MIEGLVVRGCLTGREEFWVGLEFGGLRLGLLER